MESELAMKRCKPCEGGVPPLTEAQAQHFLGQLKGWSLRGKEIEKNFQFKNFVRAMEFVNRIAGIAETEGHHPDVFLHQYNKVRITLWTHAIGGLSENDFIVAAKIDAVS